MGNCTARQEPATLRHMRQNVVDQETATPGALVFAAPSDVPPSAYIGGKPLKKTYQDFFWFLTTYKPAQKERLTRAQLKLRMGEVEGTVDEVSAAVNAAEGYEGDDLRTYELRCHEKVWRKDLQNFLIKQGIRLVFNWEPKDEVQQQVHKRMGLFQKGYKFHAFFLTEEELKLREKKMLVPDSRSNSQYSASMDWSTSTKVSPVGAERVSFKIPTSNDIRNGTAAVST